MAAIRTYEIDRAIKVARGFFAASKLGSRAFAVKVGLAAGALRTITSKAWNPTAKTLRTIERYQADADKSKARSKPKAKPKARADAKPKANSGALPTVPTTE